MSIDWSRLNDPSLRRRVLYVASVLFLVGCAWSVARRPDLTTTLRLAPALAQVLFAIPLTVAANALEFRLTARMVEAEVSFGQALEVSILGSAANLLPIPGALLVRVAQLRAGGIGARRGTSANLVVGLMWIGVAFVYAGSWLIASAQPGLGSAFVASGLAALGCSVILGRSLGAGYRLLAWTLANKVSIVLIESIRVFLCFRVLGVAATYSQSAVLVVSSVVGSAISLVPAGLGVREVVSAALAPLVGVAAPVAFLGAVVSRVLEVVVLVPLALLLARRRPGSPEPEDESWSR
jgi:hypothetical protein